MEIFITFQLSILTPILWSGSSNIRLNSDRRNSLFVILFLFNNELIIFLDIDSFDRNSGVKILLYLSLIEFSLHPIILLVKGSSFLYYEGARSAV